MLIQEKVVSQNSTTIYLILVSVMKIGYNLTCTAMDVHVQLGYGMHTCAYYTRSLKWPMQYLANPSLAFTGVSFTSEYGIFFTIKNNQIEGRNMHPLIAQNPTLPLHFQFFTPQCITFFPYFIKCIKL